MAVTLPSVGSSTDLAATQFRQIREEFGNHPGAAVDLGLPTPGLLGAFVVFGALEFHRLQILFERAVGVGVREDADIDDDIDIAGTGVGRHLGRARGDQISRCQSPYQED